MSDLPAGDGCLTYSVPAGDGCLTYSVPAGEALTSDVPAGRKGDSYAGEESESVSWQHILQKICILPLVNFNIYC
jgi:hypothetical protein